VEAIINKAPRARNQGLSGKHKWFAVMRTPMDCKVSAMRYFAFGPDIVDGSKFTEGKDMTTTPRF